MAHRPEIIGALIIALIYGVIFLIAELWRKFGQPVPEQTRKFVHLTAGAVCLSFSYVFQSHLTVLALAVSFAVIMLVTKSAGWLQSVHGIQRSSQGGIYFPLAIYLTFLIAALNQQPHFYFIAILTLSASDTLAALIGTSYGRKLYKVEEDRRSMEGTVVFFLITFLIIHLSLLLLTDLSRPQTVLAALYAAVLVTAFESISLGGSDNFFIPIGTIGILLKITTKPIPEIVKQITLIFLIFGYVYLLFSRKRNIGVSGQVGVALLCYAAQALVNFSWSHILLLGVLFYSLGHFPARTLRSSHGMRPVFYLTIVPFVWILIANYTTLRRDILFPSYAMSIVAGMNVLLNFQVERYPQSKGWLSVVGRVPKHLRYVFLTTACFSPYLFFAPRLCVPYYFVSVILTMLVALLFYGHLQRHAKTNPGKMRILAANSAVFSLVLFEANWYWYEKLVF